MGDGNIYKWKLSSDWNYQSSVLEKSGSTAHKNTELQWKQDFNNDSIIGSPIKDTNGDGLVDGAINYQFFNNGRAVDFKAYGKSYSDDSSTAWSMLAAQKDGSGFKALVEVKTGDNGSSFRQWGANGKGEYQSRQSKYLNDAEVASDWEGFLGRDLNNDKAIGQVTYLETAGDVSLYKDNTNKLYIEDSQNNAYNLKRENGINYKTSEWRDFTFIGAEKTEGKNSIAVKANQDGSIWKGFFDEDWKFTSWGNNSKTGSVAYSTLEVEFDQDFNQDGNIGMADYIQGLKDTQLKNDIRFALADDQQFSHIEMKSILRGVADKGVTQAEMSDLKLLGSKLDKYLNNENSEYQKYIYNAVVNGHKANDSWRGPSGKGKSVELGNLHAGSSETTLNRLVDKWYGGK